MKNFLLLSILSVSVFLFACKNSKQNEKFEVVKIASGGHVVHFLPLDIAVKQKLFQKYGLEPEITYLRGGTATAQALISEQVDFSTNSIDHAYKAKIKGKSNLRMIAMMNILPGMSLVTKNTENDNPKSVQDLKGYNLGVTSKGSATHMVLAYLMSEAGLTETDYNVVKAGASTFEAALDKGEIEGGMAIEPFIEIMKSKGKVNELIPLFKTTEVDKIFGGQYTMAGILTRTDVIEEKSALVHKMTQVISESLSLIHEKSNQEIADLVGKEISGDDIDLYIKTLDRLEDFYSKDGVIDSTGILNVYKSMKAASLIDSNGIENPLVFINNDFIKTKNKTSVEK